MSEEEVDAFQWRPAVAFGAADLGPGERGESPGPKGSLELEPRSLGAVPSARPGPQDLRSHFLGACSGRLAGGLFCGEVAGYLYCIPRRFFGSGGRVMDKILVATDGLSTCSPMHSRSCPCPSPPPSLVLVYFFPLNEGSCQLSLGMARDEGRITVVLRGSASPTNLFSACSFD